MPSTRVFQACPVSISIAVLRDQASEPNYSAVPKMHVLRVFTIHTFQFLHGVASVPSYIRYNICDTESYPYAVGLMKELTIKK